MATVTISYNASVNPGDGVRTISGNASIDADSASEGTLTATTTYDNPWGPTMGYFQFMAIYNKGAVDMSVRVSVNSGAHFHFYTVPPLGVFVVPPYHSQGSTMYSAYTVGVKCASATCEYDYVIVH